MKITVGYQIRRKSDYKYITYDTIIITGQDIIELAHKKVIEKELDIEAKGYYIPINNMEIETLLTN